VGEALPAEASASGQVFAVTAGTESLVPPAIVDDVFLTISTAAALEADAADALAASSEEPEFAESTQPVVTTVSAVETPAPRFGGSLPSPVTR